MQMICHIIVYGRCPMSIYRVVQKVSYCIHDAAISHEQHIRLTLGNPVPHTHQQTHNAASLLTFYLAHLLLRYLDIATIYLVDETRG